MGKLKWVFEVMKYLESEAITLSGFEILIDDYGVVFWATTPETDKSESEATQLVIPYNARFIGVIIGNELIKNAADVASALYKKAPKKSGNG